MSYLAIQLLASIAQAGQQGLIPDYIEKAETGALAMGGYGTLQGPEFDEQERLADTSVE